MYLETPRTAVRPFAPDDLDALQEILGDAETMRFSQPPNTRAQTETFLREFCIQKQGGLAVTRRADGKLIGYLLLREDSPTVYEMGWFFNRTVWRQGYALESCRAVACCPTVPPPTCTCTAFCRRNGRRTPFRRAEPAIRH